MAHWPKTVSGNMLVFLTALIVTPIVIAIAVSLSGPLVWASLAAAALTGVAIYAWRRRVDAARERAWVGEFSFGDVVARRRSEAL